MTTTSAASFEYLHLETQRHRRSHGCDAYTFADGPGLLTLATAELPMRILELGTAVGYTACVLATATPSTTVDTVERDDLHVSLALENVRSANLEDRVTVHHGDFSAVITGLDGGYDLAFFDGLSPTPGVVEHLRALLKPGGVLVCANLALSHGAVKNSLGTEFARQDRWAYIGSIEGGGTRAYRKIR